MCHSSQCYYPHVMHIAWRGDKEYNRKIIKIKYQKYVVNNEALAI